MLCFHVTLNDWVHVFVVFARMKTVKLMTQVWLNLLWQGFHRRLAGKRTEKGGAVDKEGGAAGGSMRLWEGMEGARKDVASALRQEGEEVSCRNSEVELWVGLDRWQISRNSPTCSISTALSTVSEREGRSLGSHRKPQILQPARRAQMAKNSVFTTRDAKNISAWNVRLLICHDLIMC